VLLLETVPSPRGVHNQGRPRQGTVAASVEIGLRRSPAI
jgi:hypothetical protein